MGGKVEEAVRLSVKSLTDRDSKLATQVIQRDRDINDLEIEVDEHCHKMLALYQPTAGDMRFITSSMKINSDLERMGDLAVNIAERAIALNEVAPLKPYIDLPRMAEIAQEMVRTALDSLWRVTWSARRRSCERDDEVDHLNDQIFRNSSVSCWTTGPQHQARLGPHLGRAPPGKDRGPRHQRGGRT
jgi:phosphate transport system protein